VFDVYL
jgi:hypothetical protein